MNIPHCSRPVWKNLYDAAESFREIACWEWMSDSDVFGVQTPETGEIGYCCVLGELGEVYGLVVYLGTPGLEQHRKIQSGKLHARSPDVHYSQNCLTVWFGSRADLDKTDLKVIRALDRSFSSRNSWPQYRSLRPGYLPWYLAEDEAKFLTLCLQQVREVALVFAKDPDYLTPPRKNIYLVRVPSEDVDAVPIASEFAQPEKQATLFPEKAETRYYRWDSRWLTPAPYVPAPVKPSPIDEVRIQRIKKSCQSGIGVWEIDSFYTDTPVRGSDRPFFPYAYLCADHDSGFILSTRLAEPSTWIHDFPDTLLDTIEEHKFFPRKLSLRKNELWNLFAPLAAKLEIEAELTKKLPAFDRAKRGLLKFVDSQL